MSSIIREDWIEVELGDLCFKITDGTHHTPTYTNKGVHFISVKDIYNGVVNFEKTKFISIEEHTELIKRCNPETDDLLITKSGTIGRMAIVPQKTEFSLFVSVALIKNRKDIIYSKFLMYALEDYFKSISISQVIKGGLLKNFHLEDIRKTVVTLAPLPIQRAIVSKIEALFSDLDNGIANFKKAQAQLKIYRQAVLKKAFEGELTNKNIEHGELPKEWKWELISDIAEINPLLPNKANIDRDLEVQFLPMKLVEEIINKIHLTETRKFVDVLKGSYTPFIDGDIIFAKVTPCMENGKIAIVNKLKNGIGFGSSEFHVLRCSDEINNSYLYNFIVQDTFRNKAQAAMTGAVGLRRVPKQFIENYLIPIPPTIEEQHQIVQEIESRLSVCDKMEQSITESIAKAEALRQSILKKAFEGKLLSPAEIDLCKQEADYEPASVLLEKIKAEKLAKEQAQKKPISKIKK
jgi:type I restriction enzyme S subunit